MSSEYTTVEVCARCEKLLGSYPSGRPAFYRLPPGQCSECSADPLVRAIHRYLQVDGSYGLFDALELGKAREALVELVGEPARLTLADLARRS